MKRKAEVELWAWFNKKNRMPLIMRGARQVGKSTLVRLFCQNYKLDLIELNLEIINFNTLEQTNFNIENLLDEIQLVSKKKITKETIIFFDEIQESPKLLKYLRYFYEMKPEIAIISAGSLLEFVLKDEKFSFPVGRVEFFHLGPMTYLEFLEANGNELLAKKIVEQKFDEHVDKLAKEELRKYFYIGGMPKAVLTYIENKSLVEVRHVQTQIIQTYMADFPKYNSRIKQDRINRVFSTVALHVGQKTIFQKLDSESKSRDTKKIIELLIDAKVLLSCHHSNSNSTPLMGESDETILKLYFLDIGLLNALIDLDLSILDSEFKNNFSLKGFLAEQFIAQHLAYVAGTAKVPSLFYWLKDKGSQKGEVDFILEQKQKIFPVEVKASAIGHLKSLYYFMKEKKRLTGVRFSLLPFSIDKKNHKIDGVEIPMELVSLPHYAVEVLLDILKTIE
jgi:predicted AAA+ superfamily ATPase